MSKTTARAAGRLLALPPVAEELWGGHSPSILPSSPPEGGAPPAGAASRWDDGPAMSETMTPCEQAGSRSPWAAGCWPARGIRALRTRRPRTPGGRRWRSPRSSTAGREPGRSSSAASCFAVPQGPARAPRSMRTSSSERRSGASPGRPAARASRWWMTPEPGARGQLSAPGGRATPAPSSWSAQTAAGPSVVLVTPALGRGRSPRAGRPRRLARGGRPASRTPAAPVASPPPGPVPPAQRPRLDPAAARGASSATSRTSPSWAVASGASATGEDRHP